MMLLFQVSGSIKRNESNKLHSFYHDFFFLRNFPCLSNKRNSSLFSYFLFSIFFSSFVFIQTNPKRFCRQIFVQVHWTYIVFLIPLLYTVMVKLNTYINGTFVIMSSIRFYERMIHADLVNGVFLMPNYWFFCPSKKDVNSCGWPSTDQLLHRRWSVLPNKTIFFLKKKNSIILLYSLLFNLKLAQVHIIYMHYINNNITKLNIFEELWIVSKNNHKVLYSS